MRQGIDPFTFFLIIKFKVIVLEISINHNLDVIKGKKPTVRQSRLVNQLCYMGPAKFLSLSFIL